VTQRYGGKFFSVARNRSELGFVKIADRVAETGHGNIRAVTDCLDFNTYLAIAQVALRLIIKRHEKSAIECHQQIYNCHINKQQRYARIYGLCQNIGADRSNVSCFGMRKAGFMMRSVEHISATKKTYFQKVH